MRRYLWLLIVSLALFLVTASATVNRQTGRAGRVAINLTKECAESIESIDKCPLTGCGRFGDAGLNIAKNNEKIPASGTVQEMSIARIKSFPQPATWDTGAQRGTLKSKGEGKAVRVMGFLSIVRPGGAASCNCNLTRRAQTDVRLTLTDRPEAPETASVTAVITPRVRQRQTHDPEWQFRSVKGLEGKFVRVTGWLILDTKHIPQKNRLPGERLNRALKRGTNWEVHPIIKLEVCTKPVAECGSNNKSAWGNF